MDFAFFLQRLPGGVRMNDWQSYWEQGGSFFKTACGGYERPGKFNPDALFNLVALSIEKMSMALLLRESVLPEGHTFRDLASGLEKVAPLPDGLMKNLIDLDDYQSGFCSLEAEPSNPISRDDIPFMLQTCHRLQAYVREHVQG